MVAVEMILLLLMSALNNDIDYVELRKNGGFAYYLENSPEMSI